MRHNRGVATRVYRPTITVQATPDYSDGDSVGGLITLSGITGVDAGNGVLTRLELRSLISLGVNAVLHLFDANPSASTFTDNSALSIHANDRSKLLRSFTLASASWVAPKGASPWYTLELIGPDSPTGMGHLDFDLASGHDLYMALEADGTINFSTTGDLTAVIAAWNDQ